MDELASFAEIREGEPMSAHTSFKLGGPARAMAFVKSRREVVQLVDACRRLGVELRFLGNGTNVLVSDDGVDGLVINLKGLCRTVVEARGGEMVRFFSECGVELADLVDLAADEGFSGLEFASGIPATVGGAIYTNAGTTSGDMSGVVDFVLLCDEAGRLIWTRYSRFSPRYRKGGIPGGWAVLGGGFVLAKSDPRRVRDEVERYKQRRRERQPQGALCAGSVFRNPPDDYAARMIESLGFKGTSVGGARVSEVHANFIVNEGASSADVLDLIRLIRDKVRAEFGVELELEIELWGFAGIANSRSDVR